MTRLQEIRQMHNLKDFAGADGFEYVGDGLILFFVKEREGGVERDFVLCGTAREARREAKGSRVGLLLEGSWPAASPQGTAEPSTTANFSDPVMPPCSGLLAHGPDQAKIRSSGWSRPSARGYFLPPFCCDRRAAGGTGCSSTLIPSTVISTHRCGDPLASFWKTILAGL